MKTAKLMRFHNLEQGTFGELAFGTEFTQCLELPWRDNKPQRSCIPPGTYTCRLVNSPRFGRVYEVCDVPGRSNILFHPANFAGDVERGWTTELHGCIAPCLRRGVMRNADGVWQRAGLVSKPAVGRLMDWAFGSEFQLEVVWA